MFTVAILCAFFAMRLAIHGREVEVPNLAGKSDAEATEIAHDLGLNLTIENRFYSAAVAPNHVLSQLPVAGARVRRGWQVRITESLGAQRVSVPSVIGQTERPAALALRRLQLELGTVAHLPAPSPAGVVIAQTPPPNSEGINGPRVALLLSDEETAAEAPAFVMPSLVGLTLSAAQFRLSSAGLHIASAQAPQDTPDPNDPSAALTSSDAAVPAQPEPQAFSTSSTITGQSPLPGRRVTRADNIRVTLSH